MKHEPVSARRATNVTLPAELLDEARQLGVNVSRACAAGLATEVKKERQERWISENWEAIQSSNRWVEEHGLPLTKYRQF